MGYLRRPDIYRFSGEDAIARNRIPGGITYKEAGVDIDAGNRLVELIKPHARSTTRPGADTVLGGFGGLFDLKAAGFTDPVLVAATDGVGTKLKIAILAGQHDTIGIDLVAMCVNDLIVQGAEPLFFLDYFATAALEPTMASGVVAGIAEGCRQANCALIGGETAEMPGLYKSGDYDLAGFSVGAVERDGVLTGDLVQNGDVILGLGSSGVHSNGFSLVRKVVTASGLSYDDPAPFATGRTLGDALLTPTRIYVRSVLAAIRAVGTGGIHAIAHITGGGLVENLPRVLPTGLCAKIDEAAWPRPAVFDWIADTGGIASAEMRRTFNCGIGMAIVIPPEALDQATDALESAGEEVFRIGHIVPRDGNDAVLIENGAIS